MLHQQKYLTALLERLDIIDSAQAIIDDLCKLRQELTTPNTMSIHIAANWTKLSGLNIDLTTPWLNLTKEKSTKTRRVLFPII